MTVNEEEWTYIAEGGKHALFATNRFQGKLLRIVKKDLCYASFYVSHSKDPIDLQSGPCPLQYLKMCVSPGLSPYVDTPEIVALDWAFLERLRDLTLAMGIVPAARIKDWVPSKRNPSTSKRGNPTGMLVIDYRKIPLEVIQPCLFSGRRLLFELKPKAGFLALSPLVHPGHRVKLLSSRFSLLQLLHQQGYIEKGWAKAGDGIKRSYYDPIDLFSQDSSRMKRAILSLIASPQNNLKIWYDSQVVTKDATILTDDMAKILNEMELSPPQQSLNEQEVQYMFASFVSDILVTILRHETALEKLLSLQQLDFLDVDGAILIAEHLVELCHQCKTDAENHVSATPYRSSSDNFHSLLSNSPFGIPLIGDESTVVKLCQVTEDFRNTITVAAPTLPTLDVLDNFYSQAKALVEGLSMDESSYLLSNWLLSLAMCDVSLLIRLDQCTSLASFAPPTESEIEGKNGQGVIKYISPGGETQRFAFMVRIIDCDPKPPSKLWERRSREATFSKLSMSELQHYQHGM